MGDFSKIYKYITHTPENINPAVLKSLIEMETLPSYNGLVEYRSNEVEEESK